MTSWKRYTLALLGIALVSSLWVAAAEARPGKNKKKNRQQTVTQVVTPTNISIGNGVIDPSSLPPGIQKRIANGKGLPPGLRRRLANGKGLPPGMTRQRGADDRDD